MSEIKHRIAKVEELILIVRALKPIAVQLGSIRIYWYGIIIACGSLLGLMIAMREGNRRGLSKDTYIDLIVFAVPISVICARIYYVSFEWSYYSQHPSQIIAVWNGGIAIYGALIGGAATTIVFCRKRHLPFWKVVDVIAPSVILGQSLGRWGNFMDQQAHGGPTARAALEAMHLPNFIVNQMLINGTYYTPTFLYESVWDFAGFILLLILRRVNLCRGELFMAYVIWYSLGRSYIEGLRTDSLMLGSPRISQWLSVVLIIFGIGLILFWQVKKEKCLHYLDD